jgi:hypothetical protein
MIKNIHIITGGCEDDDGCKVGVGGTRVIGVVDERLVLKLGCA